MEGALVFETSYRNLTGCCVTTTLDAHKPAITVRPMMDTLEFHRSFFSAERIYFNPNQFQTFILSLRTEKVTQIPRHFLRIISTYWEPYKNSKEGFVRKFLCDKSLQ